MSSRIHTAGLVLLILTVSAWTAVRTSITEWPTLLASSDARILLYLRLPLLPLLWIAYIRVGAGRGALVVDEENGKRRWPRYVAIGVGGLIVWLVIAAVLGGFLRPSAQELRGLRAMLPHNATERLIWIVCAPAAGVLEELVYRGFLLRRFKTFTRSTIAALGLQALIYGLAHLLLPVPMMISIALLGLFLGLLTVWQKSLKPAMLVHAGVALVAVIGGT